MDTTGTTYTFYEIEQRNKTIQEKTKTKKTNRKNRTFSQLLGHPF